ncbi:MAG: hydantoinase/oxoprolinase family protein [Alphaproteobacteria bacterium]|nr:hydantoinase/oxoprolinase family protein [Alphaproteobacteria bacterium]MDP6816362.1 hydantoinase/oxoprolinase family protein [Alphaproteobacteria bacterium]
MAFRIGIDVGGTFTDFLLVEQGGEARVCKVPSTPVDPSRAVLAGLAEMAAAHDLALDGFLGQVELIVHGTTVTTNAVLTGGTAPTGLLTTRGFRDALQMRRGIREELYDNKFTAPVPIVPRHLRLPVAERLDAGGAVVEAVELADVGAAAEALAEAGVEAVAICFLHAYANPAHEAAAAARLRQLLPAAYVSASTEVLPQVRFYERTSTTVLNAAVGPILKRYLDSLATGLAEAGFAGVLLIMQSNGGVTSPEAATRLAATTLLSGPAAAPAAGRAYALPHGVEDFITVDMGGTSFDAALIKGGQPEVTSQASVNRFALALPSMEINTVGAGGGSIAWIDDGGLLRMGPRSAGADPGPVCYGHGGTLPTCTDANLILGYLSAEYFAGGSLRLDADGARSAIREHIAKPLGMEVVAAAAGMYRIINVNMASAMQEISVKKGWDPRDFLMVCAGGAGPIHAAMIARELAMTRILVPRDSSIFCAAGMLRSDLKHDFVRSLNAPLERAALGSRALADPLDVMAAAGRDRLVGEGLAADRIRFHRALDLRYAGQYHEVTVELPWRVLRDFDEGAIKAAFHAAHDRLYGYHLAEEGTAVEVINLRLAALGLTEKPPLRDEPRRSETVDPAACKGRREVYLPDDGAFAEVDVFDGDRLAHGNRVDGPAIIEQVNTTLLVPPGFVVRCDAYGSFLLTDEAAG